jgi:hypothetical protein
MNDAQNGCANQPGTPADFISYRDLPAVHEVHDVRGRIEEMRRLQNRDGATFWRVTHVDGRLWLEGWLSQPRVQGDFNPPAGPCPHVDIWFTWSVNTFTDRPGRLVSVDGSCKMCGAPLHFVGVPFAVSLNRPTTNFEGTELRLPVTVGDEKHAPGIEALPSVLGPETPQ